MFQLDDKFLQDIGLGDMPDDQKSAFLQHIYNELELRVGTKLSEGLSDDQLKEFESIIDGKEMEIMQWINEHAPDYQTEEAFQKLQQTTGLDVADVKLRNEYVATKWLEINRPDYRQVVAETLGEIKKEITENKDKLVDETPTSQQ